MAQNQHRAPAGLLTSTDRIQLGPADLPPTDAHRSVLGPGSRVSSEPLLGKRAFLGGIELRAGFGEARTTKTRHLLSYRSFDSLTAIAETMLAYERVDLIEQIGFQSDCDFSLWHGRIICHTYLAVKALYHHEWSYRTNASRTPPSTGTIAPVVREERSEARKRTASATSSARTCTPSRLRLR